MDLSIVLILVILQLWLLTATMNAFLAGQRRHLAGRHLENSVPAAQCRPAARYYKIERPNP